jgi:hypothetical protein
MSTTSTSPIKIIFFDINGQYKEEEKVDFNKNALLEDSPIRILEKFFKENSIQSKKEIVEDLKNYSFDYEIKKNEFIKFDCYIMENFTEIHQNHLYTNYYVIFCNLENEDIFENLGNLIDFVNENYSINAKIFIIGVFKKSIDEDKTYMRMNEFLGQKGCNYEYYEMYDGDLDKIDLVSQEFGNAESMNDIFKEVFTEIYSPGQHKKNGDIDKKNDRADKSINICEIF